MGKAFQVPEKNTILRCFQYISPETIPYGRFCWNQDCQYCRVVGKLTDEERPHELLSCKFLVSAGMEITEISPELKYCLHNKLGEVAQFRRLQWRQAIEPVRSNRHRKAKSAQELKPAATMPRSKPDRNYFPADVFDRMDSFLSLLYLAV